MKRIDYKQIKEIPFDEVLKRYSNDLKLQNVAGEIKLVGHCPLCHPDGGRRPNNNQFQVTLKSKNPAFENTFRCFACGARGSVLDFVILMENFAECPDDWEEVSANRKNGKNWCSSEALKRGAGILLSPAETPGNQTWAEKWGKKPSYNKFFQANAYLESRGIDGETLKEFGVGYYFNPKSKSSLNGHILFPIENQNGELLALAWRTTTEDGARYQFPTKEQFDRTLELYNLHRALKNGENVLVVEGFFDCMNLYQLGFKCVVALMGSNLSETQADLLVREFSTVTFILDPDEAGRKLGKQALKQLICRIPLRIVKGDKQPDQMNRQEVEELLR